MNRRAVLPVSRAGLQVMLVACTYRPPPTVGK
jgi:hypothetical protein